MAKLSERPSEHVRTGFTASAFDLFHAGHIMMLREAKRQCDYLIVGLQTDPTIDRPEKNKPVQSVFERFVQLDACKYVDEIVVYATEKDLMDILLSYPIDVRILGEEYKDKHFTGRELNTMEFHFNSRRHSFSTSELRSRLAAAIDWTEFKKEHQREVTQLVDDVVEKLSEDIPPWANGVMRSVTAKAPEDQIYTTTADPLPLGGVGYKRGEIQVIPNAERIGLSVLHETESHLKVILIDEPSITELLLSKLQHFKCHHPLEVVALAFPPEVELQPEQITQLADDGFIVVRDEGKTTYDRAISYIERFLALRKEGLEHLQKSFL